MPIVTLPDGQQKQFAESVTLRDVAAAIGPGLAKAAVAGTVNGQALPLNTVVAEDATVALWTASSPEGVEVIRHSCAHLLAQAVKQLFPTAQVTIGPVIEDGFYYDFAFERAFTPEDLIAIEARMQALVKQNMVIERQAMSRPEAIDFFKGQGEHYKVAIIQDIPADTVLTVYKQGEFSDLCRGPHVPSTGYLQAFKLTKVAGAYWRGDSKNEMLQRIYGTAWPDKKALKAYLHRLEEAEKRDHRKLAKKMGLFHQQPDAPGMVFWHPEGWTLMQQLRAYVRQKMRQFGYQEINTPQIMARSLWQASGHWDKFQDDMFTTESEQRTYAIKPMNCPGHVQIFKQGVTSYRDLPVRYAEFGCCHRHEPSGTLHGLMRMRHFVQDDGHIFCRADQIQAEVAAFIEQVYAVYADFGFAIDTVKLSTRPALRVGTDGIWDKAESALEAALEACQVTFSHAPGEGAFYGPKVEFSLRDCLGRVWQCGTIQLDFSMPERLGASFVDETGTQQVPVMLHRAMLGSFERFLGILLEETAGHLPLWLAPKQAVVLTISENQADYAQSVADSLKIAGIRVGLDLRNEKIGYKIRQHTLAKVPYLLIVGDQEVADGTVAVRLPGGRQQSGLTPSQLLVDWQREIEDKRRYDLEEDCLSG